MFRNVPITDIPTFFKGYPTFYNYFFFNDIIFLFYP